MTITPVWLSFRTTLPTAPPPPGGGGAGHFTLTLPLSIHVVRCTNWFRQNNHWRRGRATLQWVEFHRGGVEISLFTSCFRNRGKLRPDESVGSYAYFTLSLPPRFVTVDSKLAVVLREEEG